MVKLLSSFQIKNYQILGNFKTCLNLVLIHYAWRFELLGKNRTKVILRHSGFTEDDIEKFDEFSQGWTWIVNWLGNYLTKGGR